MNILRIDPLDGKGSFDVAVSDYIEKERLRAFVADVCEDAARYRAMREARKQLKLYVYDDPNDANSGDWLYDPPPELVDAFVEHLTRAGGQVDGAE